MSRDILKSGQKTKGNSRITGRFFQVKEVNDFIQPVIYSFINIFCNDPQRNCLGTIWCFKRNVIFDIKSFDLTNKHL